MNSETKPYEAPRGLLSTVSEALAAANSVEQLTRPLLELLELITGFESTYLTRIDLKTRTQEILFSRNSRSMEIPEGITVPWEDTLCKRALEERCAYTDDVTKRWGNSVAARALNIRTYLSAPVYLGDGSLFGTLCAASSEQKPLTPAANEVLTLFSTLIAQHVEREQLLEELKRANGTLEAYSFYDPLTGLPNRRLVVNELRRLATLATKTGQLLLVAFIDLDGFKAINDQHGHQVGDSFLVEVGQRLMRWTRASDLVGRLGGDEFVVAAVVNESDGEGRPLPSEMYDRLSLLLLGKYELPDVTMDYPGASIGVIEADPATMAPEEMLRQADLLMYADKKARRLGMRSAAGRA